MEAQTNRKCWYYVSRSNASRILRDRNILMKSDLRLIATISRKADTLERFEEITGKLVLVLC